MQSKRTRIYASLNEMVLVPFRMVLDGGLFVCYFFLVLVRNDARVMEGTFGSMSCCHFMSLFFLSEFAIE